jgi:hypothetical protein
LIGGTKKIKFIKKVRTHVQTNQGSSIANAMKIVSTEFCISICDFFYIFIL